MMNRLRSGRSFFATTLLALMFMQLPANADPKNLAFGNPDTGNLGPKYHVLVEKDSYTMSFNPERHCPNWVAWQLNDEWLGDAGRKNNFRHDPAIPESATTEDYKNSGFDRGHMCPSADRTASDAMNSETFLLSNMVPQQGDVNRGPWERFEAWCREQVEAGKELYIYAGVSGEQGRIGATEVAVPKYCWKVVIVLPRKGMKPSDVDKNTQVVAIDMRNREGVMGDKWENYITSADEIEQVTKLDFFPAVSKRVQNVIESRVYSN